MDIGELSRNLETGEVLEIEPAQGLVEVRANGVITERYRIVRGGTIRPITDDLVSCPPPGYYKVLNVYVDPATGKLVIVYENAPV